jgi:hypothetical protein
MRRLDIYISGQEVLAYRGNNGTNNWETAVELANLHETVEVGMVQTKCEWVVDTVGLVGPISDKQLIAERQRCILLAQKINKRRRKRDRVTTDSVIVQERTRLGRGFWRVTYEG